MNISIFCKKTFEVKLFLLIFYVVYQGWTLWFCAEPTTNAKQCLRNIRFLCWWIWGPDCFQLCPCNLHHHHSPAQQQNSHYLEENFLFSYLKALVNYHLRMYWDDRLDVLMELLRLWQRPCQKLPSSRPLCSPHILSYRQLSLPPQELLWDGRWYHSCCVLMALNAWLSCCLLHLHQEDQRVHLTSLWSYLKLSIITWKLVLNFH